MTRASMTLSLVWAASSLTASSAIAADFQKHPIGPLQEAIYGFAVAEYCGMLDPVIAEGIPTGTGLDHGAGRNRPQSASMRIVEPP